MRNESFYCPNALSPHPSPTLDADECVAGIEAQSRRVFALFFLFIRAWFDVAFALLFEVVTLALHVVRKVRI